MHYLPIPPIDNLAADHGVARAVTRVIFMVAGIPMVIQ
jgi:hypothetical protein